MHGQTTVKKYSDCSSWMTPCTLVRGFWHFRGICSLHLQLGIGRSEPDGTRWRMGGEVKGKDANGVGSQQPCSVRRNMVYPWSICWSALLDFQQSTEPTPCWFKRTRPFCWKTKSGFCTCANTFQTCPTLDIEAEVFAKITVTINDKKKITILVNISFLHEFALFH